MTAAARRNVRRAAAVPLLAGALAAVICAGAAAQEQPPQLEEFAGSVSGAYHLHNPKGNRSKVGEYDVLGTGAESEFSLSGRRGARYFSLTGRVLDKNDQAFDLSIDLSRYLQSRLAYSRFQHYLEHEPLDHQDSYTDYDRGGRNRLLVEELVSESRLLLPQLPFAAFSFDYRSYRKRGHEQATTVSKCSQCHITSRNKRVDRSTNDVTAGVEMTFGPVTVAYSHLLRDFTEHAAAPRADYDDGASSFQARGVAPYSAVPDSRMNVDTLSLRSALPLDASIYASVKHGRRENRSTGNDVTFNSLATRLSKYISKNISCDVHYNRYILENKSSRGIDRDTERGGLDLTAHPLKRSTLTVSYQWEDTDRDNADPNATRKDIYRVAWSQRIRNNLRFNLHYKKVRTDAPFVNRDGYTGLSQTALPQKQDEWYGMFSWSPRYNLTLSGSLRLSNAKSSRYDSDEDRREYVVSLWYVPLERLTLAGTYTLSVTDVRSFGSLKVYHLRDPDSLFTYDTIPYDDTSQSWSFAAAYLVTPRLNLTGSFAVVDSSGDFDKHIDGRNQGNFSDLSIRQLETSLGAAWAWTNHLSLHARYLYRSYDDREVSYYDGTVSMFTMGATWSF